MISSKKFARGFLLATGFASLALCSSARAQMLLANFQASSFNATTDTLTDSVNGIVATAANGGTNVGGAGYVTTTGAGFTFNADSVPGLEGLTSYVVAVGFSYTSGAPGGANAYQGQGAFGGDLPGAGDGDANVAVTSDGNNQIVASLGAVDGNDYSVYDTSLQNGGNFITGAPTGAVLVVNGATETLYVNGVATAQGSPLTLPATVSSFTPFGDLYNGGTPTATTTYLFGIGTNTTGTSAYNPLNGDITQAQIYSGTMTATQAEALSLEIAADSAPEPSTWAMLAGGLVTLLAIGRFRRRSSVA